MSSGDIELEVRVVDQAAAERMAERMALEKLERQLIPLLNSVRERLGKPPVIVPKGREKQ